MHARLVDFFKNKDIKDWGDPNSFECEDGIPMVVREQRNGQDVYRVHYKPGDQYHPLLKAIFERKSPQDFRVLFKAEESKRFTVRMTGEEEEYSLHSVDALRFLHKNLAELAADHGSVELVFDLLMNFAEYQLPLVDFFKPVIDKYRNDERFQFVIEAYHSQKNQLMTAAESLSGSAAVERANEGMPNGARIYSVSDMLNTTDVGFRASSQIKAAPRR